MNIRSRYKSHQKVARRGGMMLLYSALELLHPPTILGSGLDSLVALFPQQKLVQEFIADGTAHRFSVGKALQSNHLYGSIGGTLPLVESPIVGKAIQASLGVSVSTELHPQQNIAVISTEFYVDYVLIDVLWTENIFSRIGIGHTSHHLSDNAFEVLKKTKPVDYSRDYVKAFVGYSDSGFRFYAGANYGYWFVIDHAVGKRWMPEAGIEALFVRFGEGLVGYGGMDIKFREELRYGSTIRFQAGVQFQNGTDRLFRLALTHQTGLEERGQFHGQRLVVTTIGLIIEF